VLDDAVEHFVRTGEPQWEFIDPNVEVHDHDIPDAGAYRGHAGHAAWLADWGDAWDDFSIEAERWIDAGERIVFVFRLTAKGKGSGVEVKRQDAMVLTVRDGKSVRVDYYNNEAQALEAAGLSAQPPRADR
jgi:ketosteroid isomerase-like protein